MNNLTAKFLNFIEKQGSKKYFIGGLLVLFSIVACSALSLNTSYAVTIDGQTVGYVNFSNTLNTALSSTQAALEEECGLTLCGTYNQVETKVSHKPFTTKMTESELKTLLHDQVEWLTNGAILNINNSEVQFALASEEDGQAILDQLKSEAVGGQQDALIKSIDFLEDVTLEATNVRISQVASVEEAFNQIKEGKEAVRTHIVQEGESLWLIAHNNDLTVSQLEALNPDLKPERLQIGQELSLTKQEPLLSVVITKEVTTEEKIAYETEYKESPKLFKGETKTVTAGVEGKKVVTYEVKEANGAALEKEVVDEVVISQPVNAVIDKGTATAAVASRSTGTVTAGSGALSWPKSGKISSPYGTRSRGFHSGIDITAKTGDPIYAAAGGTVVLSSWYYGYGNCIVVDHGNGMKTRYAHLSGYNVSVGDSVTRGQQIGRAGNTGNSTGPHLHFEVIVNGKTQNPVNYLS